MALTPSARKLLLTLHVTASVGWLGSVASFLALALVGRSGDDALLVRGAYLAMELTGWWVIVPLSVASLLTGVVQALATPWGLFRHWWVVAKLLINLFATTLLLVHMQPIGTMAAVARETALAAGEYAGLRTQLVVDAGGALLLLLVATTLSVYKPRGVIGRTVEGAAMSEPGTSNRPPAWVIAAGVVVLLFLAGVVGVHLAGGGFHHGP